MTSGQFAEILISAAKAFRKDKLFPEILPSLDGNELNDDVISKVLTPFVESVRPKLSGDALKAIDYRLAEFIPIGLERIRTNSHMHNFQSGTQLNKDSADALLVGLINDTVAPMDFALYAEDFEEVEA